jgi:hypothetical protein
MAFRTVAAPQRLHQSDNLAPLLKPRFQQWNIDKVRQQRIRGNKNMGSRDHDAKSPPGKIGKETPQLGEFIACQDRESGQRAAHTPVKRRRNSPYAAFPSTQLLLFRRGVFLKAVRRIRDDRLH